MIHNNKTPLHPSGETLDSVRAKLSGFHFAKEALSKGEREILILAESLLTYIDQEDNIPPIAFPPVESPEQRQDAQGFDIDEEGERIDSDHNMFLKQDLGMRYLNED